MSAQGGDKIARSDLDARADPGRLWQRVLEGRHPHDGDWQHYYGESALKAAVESDTSINLTEGGG
jgi:hypothetical protein